jgi:type IV secretory pathway TraG/TraD family ATPase VirD4
MLGFSNKNSATEKLDILQVTFPKNNTSTMSYSLDRVICGFSNSDPFTLNDATQGVQIFGAIGSGKTSGSGKFLAESYLRAGFGGIVLTVKNDERELWEKYCRDCGRDLLVFSPDNHWRFNFLDYELNRGGKGAGETENIVDLFLTVMELDPANRQNGGDNYWNIALKQLLRNTVDLLKIARGTLSLIDLYKIINSAPQSPSDTKVKKTEDGQEINSEWMENSFCAKLLFEAWNKEDLTESSRLDLEIVRDYWLTEFPTLADKTRSIIVSSFTGLADMFLRGTLRELFCTTTNIFPEFTHEGVVIVIDLPVHDYSKVGQYAQAIFKYIWQKSTERRAKTENLKPVFLWIDEAQFFINSYDTKFQTTARSSRACTVYLTQNLPNYLNNLGDNLTYSLLGNLQTKIFHQNSDSRTNEYASHTIGRVWQDSISTNVSRQDLEDQGKAGTGSSYNQIVEFDILPVEFSKLRKGGMENGLIVEGIVYQGGRIWQANKKSFLKVQFSQV